MGTTQLLFLTECDHAVEITILTQMKVEFLGKADTPQSFESNLCHVLLIPNLV